MNFNDILIDKYFINLKKNEIFSTKQILIWLNENKIIYNKSTLSNWLSRMSTNNCKRFNWKIIKGKDDVLFKINRDTYRLYSKDTDPLPLYKSSSLNREDGHDVIVRESLKKDGFKSISRQKKYFLATKGNFQYVADVQIKNYTNDNESKMAVIKYDRIEKIINEAKKVNKIPIFILSIFIENEKKFYILISYANHIDIDFKKVNNGYSVRFEDLKNNKIFEKSAVYSFDSFSYQHLESIEKDIKDIETDQNLSATEKDRLIKSRLGQGIFRDKLIGLAGGRCSVTNCSESSLLIASHIKPWSQASNRERLDEYNGLLLIPNFDALFDKGYITFSSEGNIIVSNYLPEEEKAIFRISEDMKIELHENSQKYMEFHRENRFKG